MDFTDVYYTSEQVLVTTTDKKDIITSTEIANNPDYKIGVQIGSIQAELAKEFTPNADIVELSKVTDIVMELSTGKLDAAFIETPVVQAYSNTYKNLQIACVIPQDDNGSVIGVYKGNEDLLKYVNEAINKCIKDGTFAQYVAKAVDLAAGDTYQGTLDENGNVPTGE
jgi:polar amino acid transport system substrate-binding protein